MSRDWEVSFMNWALPPGKTEQDKSDNAQRAIAKAIQASATLSSRIVDAFTQGSYRNRTNIKTESDVDIAVRTRASIFFDLPPNISPGELGISVPAAYPYPRFKSDVKQALVDYFDRTSVTGGSRAFDIHANTSRTDADALPCFEYRYYQPNGMYIEGTAFVPDGGSTFVNNYPDQNYANGVAKNEATGKRFKPIVRILKSLRAEMAAQNIQVADSIPSYLIECLVWNIPDGCFAGRTLKENFRSALAHILVETLATGGCATWREVNGIKFLFHDTQRWTRESVNAFVSGVWDYLGF